MSRISDLYHSALRPGRKVTDMFLLAMLITFALLIASDLIGRPLISMIGLPELPSVEEFELINAGKTTIEELTGVPAFLSFAAMYLSPIGTWIVFPLAMLIPPANRRMLRKMVFVRDARSLGIVCLCAFLGFAANSLCVGASVLLGNIGLHFEHFEAGPFFLLLFAVLIQSGSEEIAMRLFLYQKLARRYRHPAVAIVLSSAFFALMHGLNPGITWVAVAQLMVISLLCCILVYYYDSLGGCVALHMAWNFTQSILYGLPNSGIASLYSVFVLDTATSGPFFDTTFGVEGSVGGVVILLLICGGLFAYAKRHGLKAPDLWAEEGK